MAVAAKGSSAMKRVISRIGYVGFQDAWTSKERCY